MAGAGDEGMVVRFRRKPYLGGIGSPSTLTRTTGSASGIFPGAGMDAEGRTGVAFGIVEERLDDWAV